MEKFGHLFITFGSVLVTEVWSTSQLVFKQCLVYPDYILKSKVLHYYYYFYKVLTKEKAISLPLQKVYDPCLLHSSNYSVHLHCLLGMSFFCSNGLQHTLALELSILTLLFLPHN